MTATDIEASSPPIPYGHRKKEGTATAKTLPTTKTKTTSTNNMTAASPPIPSPIPYGHRKRASLGGCRCFSSPHGVFLSTRGVFPEKVVTEELLKDLAAVALTDDDDDSTAQPPMSSCSSLRPDLDSSEHSTIPPSSSVDDNEEIEKEPSPPVSWKSAGGAQHHKGAPLLVSNPDHVDETITNPAQHLGKILSRSRNVHKTGHYASNHVMMNQERTKRAIAPLIRMRELDELARTQAKAMAERGKLFHMGPQTVRDSLGLHVYCRRLGENVYKGKSIKDIHKSIMSRVSSKNNILDRRFTHMGMGTARGADGELYLCQLFRG